MSKLVLQLEDGTTMEVPLDHERITIGRRADNDVCLPNLAVSGEHAAVVTILADSFLEDLGSTNGTLVNGSAIVKHFLRDRDEIDVGRHKLVYYADENEEARSTYSSRGMKAAAGDLGEKVSLAKPIVRAKRDSSGRAQVTATSRGAAAAKPRSAKSSPVLQPLERADPVLPEPIAPPPKPSVKILSGPQAGRDIPLAKDETSVGRAGVQVAVISQAGDLFRLKTIEGDIAPMVNGRPAPAEGVDLSPGDVIEIAGSRLEFVYRA